MQQLLLSLMLISFFTSISYGAVNDDNEHLRAELEGQTKERLIEMIIMLHQAQYLITEQAQATEEQATRLRQEMQATAEKHKLRQQRIQELSQQVLEMTQEIGELKKRLEALEIDGDKGPPADTVETNDEETEPDVP